MFNVLNFTTLKILHRIDPNLIWNLYGRKCKKIFNNCYFILSFDCDTEEDISVAEDVHSKLRDIGVTSVVYAVPGKLLRKGEKVYSRIFENGAEFINHGGREHTYFDTKHNRHASCFFYDQQTPAALTEDIIEGHKTLKEVLGVNAKGWRTPHFGSFQNPDHLKFLYKMLKSLGYVFSTSTSPRMAYQYGPIYKRAGIIEIPVTGIMSEPFNIMDTWTYFAAADRSKSPSHYLETSQNLASKMLQFPLLINIYGDPSHIYDKPEFFQGIKTIVEVSENINYSKLLKIAHENL